MTAAVVSVVTPAVAQTTSSTAALEPAQDNASTGTSTGAERSDEINTGSLDRQLVQELVVRYTNEERQKADLKPLQPDEPLQKVAEKHSRDMAKRGYFSHTSQREDQPDIPFEDRVSLEKLGYKRTGENIALQPVVQSRRITTRTLPGGETQRDVKRDLATYDELARETVDGWMKSPGHRKNILTPEFNLIGIGVATGEREGTPYAWITQNFGQK